MELDDALMQIGDIQRQMARTRMFRGYRAGTTGLTGVVAIAASAAQAWWLPNPAGNPGRFVDLWVGVAIVNLVFVGFEIAMRYRRTDSSLERELTMQAIEQFLPSIVTGGLLTVVLTQFAWRELWMLPGLWCIMLGLGIFASRRLLPGAIVFVGAFYLLCGFLSMATARMGSAFSPWAMGLPFGLGQLAAAAVLKWKLERNHES